MKILQLKYKMHKLVNLVFYLIIFGIGFILGFGSEKINFNKVISQFLFIDNVSAEESIDEQEITYDCRDSVNLFDKNTCSMGTILNRIDGTLNVHIDFCVSGYIKVQPNATYYASNFDWWYTAFYDKDKNYVGYPEYNPVITIPSNVEYIRLSVLNTNIDIAQFEQGSTGTTYEPYGEQICEELISSDNSFYNFSQNIFGEVDEENKFIYDFITFGLVVTCFTLFVLIVGYIFKKFFGG